MNLWAKRIGQLAVLAVALFFFSCQDEAGLLGYKNPNSKFQVKYIEIPIESSVLLLDSQRTSNLYRDNKLFNGQSRLLIGQYVDDQIGSVSAAAYTQFFTNSFAKLQAGSIFDSVTLKLKFDFYNYGSTSAVTQQTISVYELDEDLIRANRYKYVSKSEVQVKSTPLGSKIFTINPTVFNKFITDQVDTTINLKIPLSKSFGEQIFESAIRFRDVNTTKDSTFKVFDEFTKIFKGLAFKSENGDKIFGIDPYSSASGVVLHYHYPKDTITVNETLTLGFLDLASFTQIKGDRGGTPLAGLNQYSQDFNKDGDLRYVQSGIGIYTKLDFSKFYEFADTIPNIVINSAQLSVESVEESIFPPPSSFTLRMLTDDNFVKKYNSKNPQDSLDIAFYNPRAYPSYQGSIGVDGGAIVEPDNAFYAHGDQSDHLIFSSKKKSYDGNYSLFFQQLSVPKDNKSRFRYFILYPSSPGKPSNTKTVNRAIFPKSGIKLKVYYTKPTTPLN